MPVEQTMEKRTRRIVIAVLSMTLATKNFASCTEISSVIGFNSDEDERDSNDSGPKAVVDLNEVVYRQDLDSTRSGDLKRLSGDFPRNDSTKQPDATANLQIVINGKEMRSGVDACKSGVCKVSVTSNLDEEGNIVTDVHLRVITKVETDLKLNDIPVIDGVRGIENPNVRVPDGRRASPFRPPSYIYNIPQIQTRYRDGEPWYQGRRNFQRLPIAWHYHRQGESPDRRFVPANGGRSFSTPVVDDKIEPPFSKTQASNE